MFNFILQSTFNFILQSTDKKFLLSIGEFSKLTATHVKSLHYYERLGILLPAYIDPESGYRYYDQAQRETVDAIRFCIELGIPLRELSQYIKKANDATTIQYGELLAYGLAHIPAELKRLQSYLKRLQTLQSETLRGEIILRSDTPIWCVCPELVCWLVPCNELWGSEEFLLSQRQAALALSRGGLHPDDRFGLLLRRERGKWRQFYFAGVVAYPGIQADHPDLFFMSEQACLCMKKEGKDIWAASEWGQDYFQMEQLEYVIEEGLIVNHYTPDAPFMELRCYLKTEPQLPAI